MIFEYIETPRLQLRKYSQDIADYIFKNYSDDQLKLFLNIGTAKEMEKEKEQYSIGYSTYNKTFLYFHLLDKNSKRLIGWCGYHTWYPKHSRAELGYEVFSKDDMGKGFMSEALDAVIKYGFLQMNLHRIEAFLASYNSPSMKLMEKFNFVKEGNLRKHYFVNGKMEDSLVFSLLKSD